MKDDNNNNNNDDHSVKPIVDRPDLADKIENKVDLLMDTKVHNNEFEKEEVNKFKNLATASYIPFVSLFLIFTGKYKKSKYLFFHTNQGLIVTVLFIAVFFFTKILGSMFTGSSLIVNSAPGWVEAINATLYFLVILLILFGTVNTVNNNSKELPIVGKIKLLK